MRKLVINRIKKFGKSENGECILSMLDANAVPIMLIDPETGLIEGANPSACDFYGYTLEELCNVYISDIVLLPPEKIRKECGLALKREKTYFALPNQLKNGNIRLADFYSNPIFHNERWLLSFLIFDVTEREANRKELISEKEMLHTTLQSIGDGVITTDVSGIVTSLNWTAQKLICWTNLESVGKHFSEIIQFETDTKSNPIKEVLEKRYPVHEESQTILINRMNRSIPISFSAAPIKSEIGEILGVVMVFRDISKFKEQNDHIRFLSYHDALTGLYNRHYIDERLNLLDTQENLPFAVMTGDVNGLKITNDIFGHKAGDQILQFVAEILKKQCRSSDIIARWGGDEFVVFMPKADSHTAEGIIDRIKNDCECYTQGAIRVSLSLGCAVKRKNADDLEKILKSAEENMYHQKLLDGKSYRNAIINTLLATLNEKNMETEEHTIRLEALCRSIGHRLSLSSKEMDELSLLALLHDIGKIGISQNVLEKPGKLTQAEWAEMKRHPEIGYRIAQATPELSMVSDFILSHHERFDGSGYPRGLKGAEVPLVCRILAVVDSYDAMTNDRIYRKALSKKAAVQELEDNAGTQFDPEIAALFVQMLRSGDIISV